MRLKPKKSLGQNFLADKNIRNKIISACDFKDTDTVIEIGAGRGELTSLIAPRVKLAYALEIDPRLGPCLEEISEKNANLRIIGEDALKADLTGILSKVRGKIKVVGNIPYCISTPIIEKLIGVREKVGGAFITVQKEFAQRIASLPGSKDYGALSCFVQYYTEPKILFFISRGCFWPVPKVDSAFLKLRFREKPAVYVGDPELLFKVIRASFNQRRKTLRSSLKKVIAAQKLEAFLRYYRIRSDIRPEQLSLQDFASLINYLKKD
ncbi:MAG: ribosomal RNA small subunit methyltransferase A [Candidatus Omnitrophica bacterium]|nr:ribosomal RNA small subunit methyltransferase A [Candidatus Omnitrophota bacterium]